MSLKKDGISVRQNLQNNTYAYIQQYLPDLDPDVDAIVNSFFLFVDLFDDIKGNLLCFSIVYPILVRSDELNLIELNHLLLFSHLHFLRITHRIQ